MNASKINKKIILFDGVCNMCNQFVYIIIKLDYKNQFVFTSLQGGKGQEIISSFKIDSNKLDSIILLNKNQLESKSQAVISIITSLNIIFKLLSILKIIPKNILDIAYDFIAKNRYKAFGKRDNCSIPDEKYKSRFI